jgi:tetratricopeptide (TPR) repeat protein
MRSRSIAIVACALVAAALLAALYLGNVEKTVPASNRTAGQSVPRSQEGLPIGSFRHAVTQTGEPNASNVSHSFRVELAELRAHLDAHPADTAALARTALLLHGGHVAEEAIEYYERYLAQGGARRDVLLGMAGAAADAKRWEAAERAMVALLDTSPDDAEAMYNLGAVYANRGNYEIARSWWERVRDLGGNPTLAAQAATSLERLPPSSS